MHSVAIDLNLLKLFDVLLEERSVTRAGERLGLSQSAVSHALSRLRLEVGDPLFQRTAQGMTPTARALEMGPQVRAALGQLQAAISPPVFDPLTTSRRFTIVTGSYPCTVLAPELIARLSQAAPGARLVVAAPTDLQEQLDSQRADFAITIPVSTPPRVASDVLFRETLAWAVRADHPLALLNKVGLDDLLAWPHVEIEGRPPGPGSSRSRQAELRSRTTLEDVGALESEVSGRGLTRNIGVTVPDAHAAVSVVRRSSMAALVPRRLAMVLADRGDVKLIEPPYDSPSVDLHLVYLRERLADPAIRWMRALVCEVAAAVAPQGETVRA